MSETKPFAISKQQVMQAYRLVKANRGAAGVDQQSLDDFSVKLKDNLYKLWNRMSSGSYFPAAVKAVSIPKKAGGERVLGVPTVADRIAQMVVKLELEPIVEPHFLPDSYAYRPGKSALDAIGVTRKRCWKYDWVLEFDVRGLFDNIPHDLILRAVQHHTENKWVILYIERWLKAPMQRSDGTLVQRTKGTPQGGVVSPLLANLFLHYTFDAWVQRNYPDVPWCRYADDGLLHFHTERRALEMWRVLDRRFSECGIELHSEKTKIVYCKDGRRTGDYSNVQFDFLGYTFRRRVVKNSVRGNLFVGFTPMVSKAATKSMRAFVRRTGIRNQTHLDLKAIAKRFNPILAGWIDYYGRYHPSGLKPVLRHFNKTLVVWAMAKYKRLRKHKTQAGKLLQRILQQEPNLFEHWKRGMAGTFT